ncbi:chitin disaccharide deacetylase [soil metagenome]
MPDDSLQAEPHYLIVNADDFGASRGINRGIVECHRHGIVTSTSLMVTGRALDDAVRLAADNPELAIGLHWDVIGEDEREFDLRDHAAVESEFDRQLECFVAVMGRMPAHVDSHRHLHMQAALMPLFEDLVASLGLPLRGDGNVCFVGDFYAQPEWRVTDLDRIGVPYLLALIDNEVGPGWTEIGCHPGYVDADFHSVYHAEREHEIASLKDPRIRRALHDRNIRLASYADFRRD